MPAPERSRADTLPLLKALADDTRFRCFEVVRDSGRPVSVAEVAEWIGLHQNTIRPHLDRLCEVGVLVVETHQRGTVGRPQHLYSLSDDAPALGLGPRSYHLLSELLAGLAARLARPDDAVEIGREWGRKVATLEPPLPGRRDPIDVVCAAFERLGFDPFADDDRVAFAHCPFRELAEAHPDLICSLHRGLTEGVLEAADGSASLAAFHPLHAAEPCTAVLRR